MGSNIGFMLSLVFVVQVLLLSGDLVSIQAIYGHLDALSLSVNQMISRQGGITPRIEQYVETQEVEIYCIPEMCSTQFGETYEYKLVKTFTPLIMSKDEMKITIKRSVIIGYFN